MTNVHFGCPKTIGSERGIVAERELSAAQIILEELSGGILLGKGGASSEADAVSGCAAAAVVLCRGEDCFTCTSELDALNVLEEAFASLRGETGAAAPPEQGVAADATLGEGGATTVGVLSEDVSCA
jgi:hypothetical protein